MWAYLQLSFTKNYLLSFQNQNIHVDLTIVTFYI